MTVMRIALVSPYSWSYPGGVTRHIDALASQYRERGHYVRVLAPVDPPGKLSSGSHRGARPQPIEIPEYLISLGRTVGFKANGSVSNLSISPAGSARLVHELALGEYDVAHIHEPIVPLIGWTTSLHWSPPLVGTFHTYSTKWLPNQIATGFGARQVLNHVQVRIAVSEAAKWTGERWYGGRYRIIPNGVLLDQDALDAALARPTGDVLKILFVGQAVERKGLPLLLRAFEAVREHVPAELTVIGPTEQELAPLLMDPTGVRALGKVDDQTKQQELLAADVLAAPSLGGESFGMVLTEAFATGTTVIASDIGGYRDVVTHRQDGVLIPPGDAQRLAMALRELYFMPKERVQLARNAAETVKRFAWETVADQVLEAYDEAIAIPAPQGAKQRFAVRTGLTSADLQGRVPAKHLPSLEPAPETTPRKRIVKRIRRVGVAVLAVGGVALAYEALQKIGIQSIANALTNSSPVFVALGLIVMCAAMLARAVSWHAILSAALPKSHIRLIDAMQGTMIGVLMSSTLPARLGEPARAIVVARRSGRPRENLPVVLGTQVSQTLLNILALIILGTIMFSSVNFFTGHEHAMLLVAIAPVALLIVVLLAPVLLRYGPGGTRFQRAHAALVKVTEAMRRVRAGLTVFTMPRLGAQATLWQLGAWALQAFSCYLLLKALGLHHTGFAAAAAVLFAVNVTAVLPVTPANLGVFQAACATVLHSGWHVGFGTGVAYGVILQAIEVATAILMGTPALLREGMSWKEVRLRAMNSTPIKLPPRNPAASRARATDGQLEAGN